MSQGAESRAGNREDKAIRLRVLGCYGGKTPGFHTTSFLLNERLLVDAGSAASTLTLEEQAHLEAVLVTHSHLDHVAEIPYLVDNTFGMRDEPLAIVGIADVLGPLRQHIFNDLIWPDFSAITCNGAPALKFVEIREGEKHAMGGIAFTAHRVNHQVSTTGFIFSDANGSVLFTADTAPTQGIWERGRKCADLRAIITEVSLPTRLQNLADAAKHFTPATLRQELQKMPADVPIYLFHIKSQYQEEILTELQSFNESRLQLLQEGKTYLF